MKYYVPMPETNDSSARHLQESFGVDALYEIYVSVLRRVMPEEIACSFDHFKTVASRICMEKVLWLEDGLRNNTDETVAYLHTVLQAFSDWEETQRRQEIINLRERLRVVVQKGNIPIVNDTIIPPLPGESVL